MERKPGVRETEYGEKVGSVDFVARVQGGKFGATITIRRGDDEFEFHIERQTRTALLANWEADTFGFLPINSLPETATPTDFGVMTPKEAEDYIDQHVGPFSTPFGYRKAAYGSSRVVGPNVTEADHIESRRRAAREKGRLQLRLPFFRDGS